MNNSSSDLTKNICLIDLLCLYDFVDYTHIAISARLAHADLVAADAALEASFGDHAIQIILIKQLLIACSNVFDLEKVARPLYRENPSLSDIITPHQKEFEFAKYLRNIAVGHVNPSLSEKAFEWRPELSAILTRADAPTDVFLNYAVLETAINTFVDGEKHKIFDSDTDLLYPLDMRRFLNFLGTTVHTGISYCRALSAVALKHANLPEFEEHWLKLAVKAAATDFTYITRKKK